MTVRVATPADVDAILDTLMIAFVDDPFVAWVVGGRGERARRRYFALTTEKLTLPHGTVYTTDDHASVALFAPSERWQLSAFGQLTVLPRVARVIGLSRFREVSEGVELVERGRPREPFLLLTLLATRPEARGRGLASAVLAHGLELCDREGRLAVLDTSNEANVPFYERRGFSVTHRLALPNGPRVWSMTREPRTHAAR